MKVLVTGGSRGIGESVVRRLSAAGHDVSFTYLKSEDRAESVAKDTNSRCYKCDVTSESDIKKLKTLVKDVDALVLNAGISSFDQVQDVTSEKWRLVLDTNLTGAFLTVREFVSGMISSKRGKIVALSSMWARHGSSCESHYSASKGGLEAFVKSLAKELGPSGINVNAVAPGFIGTDMNASLSEEAVAEIVSETPLQRAGTPGDVAAAVEFLLSDDSSFITGAVLPVDGGYAL